MRLSYSLLDHYLRCAFRSKLTDFDRVPRPAFDTDRIPSWIRGTVAHAGQAMVLRGGSEDHISRACWTEACRLLPNADDPTRLEVRRRAFGAVLRWRTSFRPERFKTAVTGLNHPFIDFRVRVPIRPAVGIFDELTIQPDWVCVNENGQPWLWDWKWQGSALDEEESLRYDKQAVLYQWGLARLGVDVRGCGRVHGRLDEPSRPKITKKGTVSRQAVLCSWEDYLAIVEKNGEKAADYLGMQPRLTRFFKEHIHYRSRREVDATWEQVIVPLAEEISASAEGRGFVRRMQEDVCQTCLFNEDCMQGLFGTASHPAFNTRFALQPASRPADTREATFE